MKTQIYEGQRILCSNASGPKIVTFKQRHDTIPFITLALEGAASEANTKVLIEDVNLNTATVNFSSPFDGYLHVHVFSKLAA